MGDAVRPNPRIRAVHWSGPPTYEAKLLIGLEVKDDAALDIFTIMAMVHDLLVATKSNASSGFVAQCGTWQEERDIPAEFEKSVSVRLIAGERVHPGAWASAVQRVTRQIATLARQDLVLLEFSLNGVLVETFRVTPGRASKKLRPLSHFRERGREVRAASTTHRRASARGVIVP